MGRYEKSKIVVQVEGNQTIQYLERRFLPKGEEMGSLGETWVGADERLDQMATRVVGDPLKFWKLADTNNAMNPLSLLNSPTIKIPKSE